MVRWQVKRAVSLKPNPFRFKQRALQMPMTDLVSRKPPITVDDALPRHRRSAAIDMEDTAHLARPSRHPCDQGHLPVSQHTPARNRADYFQDFARKGMKFDLFCHGDQGVYHIILTSLHGETGISGRMSCSFPKSVYKPCNGYCATVLLTFDTPRCLDESDKRKAVDQIEGFLKVLTKTLTKPLKSKRGLTYESANPLLYLWCRSRDLNPDRPTPTRP